METRIPAGEVSGGAWGEKLAQGQDWGPCWKADKVADRLAAWGQDALRQFKAATATSTTSGL